MFHDVYQAVCSERRSRASHSHRHPPKGGAGSEERGEGRAKGEETEVDEWVSAKAGLMGAWIDGFSDGCSGGGIQACVSAGSRLISHAYVLLPRGYEQSAGFSRITANRFCYRSH